MVDSYYNRLKSRLNSPNSPTANNYYRIT